MRRARVSSRMNRVNGRERLAAAGSRSRSLASRGELGEFKNQLATQSGNYTHRCGALSQHVSASDLHLVLVSLSILAIATVCLTGHIHGHIW